MTDPLEDARSRVTELETELRTVRDQRLAAQRQTKEMTSLERALESAGRERDAAISPEVLALQRRVEAADDTIREARLSTERKVALWGNVKRRQLGARAVVGEDRAARLESTIADVRTLLEEVEHGAR